MSEKRGSFLKGEPLGGRGRIDRSDRDEEEGVEHRSVGLLKGTQQTDLGRS